MKINSKSLSVKSDVRYIHDTTRVWLKADFNPYTPR